MSANVISKAQLRSLRPTVSGEIVRYVNAASNSDKHYRVHLSYVGPGWVAWGEYGRRGQKPQRTLITKHPVAAIIALNNANKRVREKVSKKGYRGPGGEAFGIGEISKAEQSAAYQLMMAAHELSGAA